MKTRAEAFRKVTGTIVVLFAVIAVDASVSGHTQKSLPTIGQASGTLVIDDGKTRRTVNLKHAYAAYYSLAPRGARDWRGEWVVELSDQPLPDNPLQRRDLDVPVLAVQGKINVLILEIRPRGRNSYFVDSRIYCDISKSQDEYPFYMGSFHEAKQPIFNSRVFNKQRVAGAARTSNIQFESGKTVFGYDVTFNANVVGVYESTLFVDGAAEKARIAYQDFHDAVNRESVGSAANLIAAEHRKLFEGANANQRLSRLKVLINPYSKILLFDVYAPGKTALLSASRNPGEGKSGEFIWVRLVLENSQWKVHWLMLGDRSINVIENIDTYRTIEEMKKE